MLAVHSQSMCWLLEVSATTWSALCLGKFVHEPISGRFVLDGDDRRIPNLQVPRSNGFFLGPLQKSNFWGDILIIKKLAFEIKISQYTYHCQASFFIDVNLQAKELRKIVKLSLAVEGTTYRGRCKSLLCAEMTLTFEAFLGCAPIIPFRHDMIPLACPIIFHLTLMWDDEGARV